ncbi:MAG TPA: hydrogenase 2 operon protein HybA [Anaeromyxobacter sp.]|nr:hydrogenase 2 operon protein HybA [Anaeromyxobacter sp.]
MSGLSRRRLLQGALVAGAAAAIPRTAQAREPVSPEPGAVGMLYDSTRCLDCGACVAACKEANGLPYRDEPHELDCETKSVVKTRHLSRPAAGGAASAFVKRQCMHCVDPSCVSVCVLGALHKEGRGKRDSGGERAGSGIVLYDPTLCLGCRYCQIACAYSVPKFQWFEAVPRIVKCELCRGRADPAQDGPRAVANPACAEVCPAEAVVYGRRADLLAEARRRLAAEPQRYNPKIFGERDGGGTQVLYLAGAGVSFRDLGFPDMPEKAPADLSESVSHAPYLHGLTPIALYAAAAWIINRHRNKESPPAEPKEKP